MNRIFNVFHKLCYLIFVRNNHSFKAYSTHQKNVINCHMRYQIYLYISDSSITSIPVSNWVKVIIFVIDQHVSEKELAIPPSIVIVTMATINTFRSELKAWTLRFQRSKACLITWWNSFVQSTERCKRLSMRDSHLVIFPDLSGNIHY